MWNVFFAKSVFLTEQKWGGGAALILAVTTRGGGVTDRRHQKLKASGKVDAVPRPCRERVGRSNFLGSCRFLLQHLVGAGHRVGVVDRRESELE